MVGAFESVSGVDRPVACAVGAPWVHPPTREFPASTGWPGETEWTAGGGLLRILGADRAVIGAGLDPMNEMRGTADEVVQRPLGHGRERAPVLGAARGEITGRLFVSRSATVASVRPRRCRHTESVSTARRSVLRTCHAWRFLARCVAGWRAVSRVWSREPPR